MEPFVGEIRLFSFARIPRNWVACDGSLLQITTHQALFALLGIQFGGDGRNTFGIPDLRGRVPQHISAGAVVGSKGGQESVVLTTAQIPSHNHLVAAYSTAGNTAALASAIPAQCTAPSTTAPAAPNIYAPAANLPAPSLVPVAGSSVSSYGGQTPHENRQPLIALSYCIAVNGLWPSRS